MDDNRKKELYGQLKDILAELKEGGDPLPVVEQLDDGILRIHLREAVGSREKIGG